MRPVDTSSILPSAFRPLAAAVLLASVAGLFLAGWALAHVDEFPHPGAAEFYRPVIGVFGGCSAFVAAGAVAVLLIFPRRKT
jgi:hypothetical protein